MTEPVGERLAVQITRLDADLPMPSYARPGDAGLDLHAREGVTLAPGERALIATGVAIALPQGYGSFVHPRSGLAARHGVTTVNGPGTVDSGYRGEIKVNLINHDPRETFVISRGDRIAQLVIQRVVHADLIEVESLPDSIRGETGHGASGGFGSTSQSSPDSRPLAGTTARSGQPTPQARD